MTTNLDRYKKDLDSLFLVAKKMDADLTVRALEERGKLSPEHQEIKKKYEGTFEREYQSWYTEAHSVIRQIIPDRLKEFELLYQGEGKRKQINATTFTIQDWLTGVRSNTDSYGKKYFGDVAIASMRFQTQRGILSSAEKRFQSSLFDIRQLVQADLFDSELDVSRELLKHGFLRAAGAVSGVVLEKHMGEVCNSHNTPITKKSPCISDFNDALKTAGVVDVPTWRFIQRLGDLRNLCDHNKSREPTKDEISELIEGTSKITKTLF